MRKRVTGRPDTLPRTGKRVRTAGSSCGRRTLPSQVEDREPDQPERIRNEREAVAAPDAGVWRLLEICVFGGSG
jgi:hypothetical protein